MRRIATFLHVGVLLAATPAAAGLRSEYFVSNEVLGVPTTNPEIEATTGPLTDAFFFTDPTPLLLPTGTLRISTDVDYGFLQLTTSDRTLADDFDMGMISMDHGTRATGQFTDTVTLDAPGLTGLPGSLTAVVRFTGHLEAYASGEALPFTSFSEASANLDLAMGTASTLQRFRSCSTMVGSGSACLYGDDFGILRLGPISFVFGQPFPLSLQASASTFSRTVPTGVTEADADLGFTVQWLGIEDVSDGQGGPVAGYSLESDQGIDWSQPLPEPRAALLAWGALGGVVATRRRSAPH